MMSSKVFEILTLDSIQTVLSVLGRWASTQPAGRMLLPENFRQALLTVFQQRANTQHRWGVSPGLTPVFGQVLANPVF